MTTWLDSDNLMSEAKARVLPADVILDIGCGIRPQSLIKPKVMIAIDAHHEYIKILRDRFAGTNAVIINGQVPKSLESFPDRSVDTIFMLDFIEHIEKEDGIVAIRECERIMRKQIVIYTPLGFMPQHEETGGADGWHLDGTHWQKHRSGWEPEDFDETWDILACKEYHMINGEYKKFDPPFGALWAIKTIKSSASATVSSRSSSSSSSSSSSPRVRLTSGIV